MKPTELCKHNAIYVNETDEVLLDDDYQYVVITIGAGHNSKNEAPYLLEKLQNGELTKIELSNLSSGDTITLLPCLYGFCISLNSGNLYIDGSYSNSITNFQIDLSHYNTKKITDFSGMFVGCTNIISKNKLNTSNGKKFDYMFSNSSINEISIDLSSAETANCYFPRNKYATLNLTGSKLSRYNNTSSDVPETEIERLNNLLNNTTYFFDYNNSSVLNKIITDDFDFAYFINEMLAKQKITTINIVKPNGSSWDLNS